MTHQGRIYAIGDIHGFAPQLHRMMAMLGDDGMVPERDVVIFLGDYVDRGPASAEVVRVVRELTGMHPHWWALSGNHEQMMRDAIAAGPANWSLFGRWWTQGGRETTASFAGKPLPDVQPEDARSAIPSDVLAWVEERPRLLIGDRYAFAHAGVRPNPRWQTDADAHDLVWIRDEFLTSTFDFGHIIVHGHTPISEPVVRPNRIGIDTILKTGKLTAVELSADAPRFIQTERGHGGRE